MCDSELNCEGPHAKTFIHDLFKAQSRKNEHITREVFSKELKKLVNFQDTRPHNVRSVRFPSLAECRNDFEEKYGIKITEPG